MLSSHEIIDIPESLCLSLKSRKLSVHVRQCYCGFPHPCSNSAPDPAHKNQLLLFLLWPVMVPRTLTRSCIQLPHSASSHWVGHSPVTPSPPVGLGVPVAALAPELGSATGSAHCHTPRLHKSTVTSPSQGHRPWGQHWAGKQQRVAGLRIFREVLSASVCEQTRVRLRWAHVWRIWRIGCREGM